MAAITLTIDTARAEAALTDLSALCEEVQCPVEAILGALETIEPLEVNLDQCLAGGATNLLVLVQPSQGLLDLMTAFRTGDIDFIRGKVERHSSFSDGGVDNPIVDTTGAGVERDPVPVVVPLMRSMSPPI